MTRSSRSPWPLVILVPAMALAVFQITACRGAADGREQGRRRGCEDRSRRPADPEAAHLRQSREDWSGAQRRRHAAGVSCAGRRRDERVGGAVRQTRRGTARHQRYVTRHPAILLGDYQQAHPLLAGQRRRRELARVRGRPDDGRDKRPHTVRQGGGSDPAGERQVSDRHPRRAQRSEAGVPRCSPHQHPDGQAHAGAAQRQLRAVRDRRRLQRPAGCAHPSGRRHGSSAAFRERSVYAIRERWAGRLADDVPGRLRRIGADALRD